MKILNFGSLNIDKTYTVQEIVKPGETISSINYEEFIGGKGLNQSVALAKAGADVWHAGLIGSDGGPLSSRLRESGVHMDFVREIEGASGHAVIQINHNGMNCIIVEPGTNGKVDETFVDEVLENFSPGDFILLQNEIANVPYIVENAHERGLIIVLNPSPMNAKVHEIDLSLVDYFLINEHEGSGLTDKVNFEEILDAMLEIYPKSKTVLTVGAKGSYYSDETERFHTEPVKVNTVDTTGAGDTFTGYFLASIAKGLSTSEAMDLASRASAMTVQKKGASNAIPYLEEVQ